MKTEIFLVRHGEPQLKNVLLGSTDCDLTDFGKTQLKYLYDQPNKFDQIISSPLKRCADFAKEWSDSIQCSLTIDSSWKEYDFGDWDGLSYQQLKEKYPEEFSNFTKKPTKYFPPNAESVIDFSKRLERNILQLVNDYQGKKIAMITHAGVIRSLVAWCLNIDYQSGVQFQRFTVDYASMTQISFYHGNEIFPQLINLNQCLKSSD